MARTAWTLGRWTLLLSMLVWAAGCWDQKELNEVAVVIGVGMDKADNNMYKVTAQVIKPNPKQGRGASGGSEIPTWSLTASDRTVMDAIIQLNRISPRRLYWPHLQIIVFGEKLAREGVAPILTFFERDRDNRSGTYLAVTHGTAENLLNQKIELGNVPAKAMADLLETAPKRQISVQATTLRKFAKDIVTPGIDPVVDVIDPQQIRGKTETYRISQLAVFKDDKLKSFLSQEEAVGVAMASGKYEESIFTVPCPGAEKGFVNFLTTDFRIRSKPDYREGELTVKYDIFIEGNIGDQTCKRDTMDQDFHQELNRAVGKRIQGLVNTAFQKTRKVEADAYGLGREVFRHYPSVWTFKLKENPRYLEDINIQVAVEANVRRSGLNFKPSASKLHSD